MIDLPGVNVVLWCTVTDVSTNFTFQGENKRQSFDLDIAEELEK